MSSDSWLFDHLAQDVEDLRVIERNALGGAGLALEDFGLDQPQRRDAASVATLHGVSERSVDLFAQHGYGLFPKCVRERADARTTHYM